MNPSTALNAPPRAGRRRPALLRLSGLVSAALLLCLGCAKSSSATLSPGAYEDGAVGAKDLPPAPTYDVTLDQGGAGYADEADYDFEADLAEGEMMAREQVAAPASRSARRFNNRAITGMEAPAKQDKKKGKAAPAGDTRDATAGGEQAEPAEAPTVEVDDDTPKDHGREIIYTAGLQVSVYDLEDAMAKVEAIPDQYGGWIHMRNQSMVVLRIPAAGLKPAMAQIGDYGVVEARTLQAQDVTAEYVDLESRIKVLRETQAQLLALLGKAKTVEEALHVRRSLDDVTMALEMALGRMRQLSDLIAFSTLTVTLVERGPQDQIPTSNDPFRWVDQLGVENTEWR